MNQEPKKCSICKTHKGKRYCLRTDKRICWLCCNELRVDFKCPETCEYHATENLKLTENKIKTDSLSEFYDFLDKHTSQWIKRKSDFLDGDIPILLLESQAGKDKLIKKLRSLNLEKRMAEIYEKHLNINLDSRYIEYSSSFEDIAKEFLQDVGEQDWEKLPEYFAHKEPRTIDSILKRLKNNKNIKELSYFTVMASGLSQDGNSAFSSVELNYKQEMSVLFVKKETWLIDNIIFSDINLIYSETDAIKHIASAFVQKDYRRALQLINQAEDIYYLSPDVQYYKGLYYSLQGEKFNALDAFTEASNLDPFFAEAIFNQAFIYQSEKDFDQAKKLYEKTLSMQTHNVNAMNNMGTIYLFEQDYENARLYFNKCLEVSPDFQYAIDNLQRIEELEKLLNNVQ